jgi:invasion protein IalB
LPAEKYSPRPVQSAPKNESADHGAIVYSPWTKFCGTESRNPQVESVCLTVKEARLEAGQFLAGVALVEQAGNGKKLLRISLPLGIRLMPGARVFIDGEAMRTLPPLQCMASVCIADFEVTADFVAKLKRGDRLKLEGVNTPVKLESINIPGWIATWPLVDFAKAFDGPPTDPKTFDVEQKKRQEELQNRIEQERRRSN